MNEYRVLIKDSITHAVKSVTFICSTKENPLKSAKNAFKRVSILAINRVKPITRKQQNIWNLVS